MLFRSLLTENAKLPGLDGDKMSKSRGNTIAMHVTRLRARLGSAAVVRRIRGRGYSLTIDPA